MQSSTVSLIIAIWGAITGTTAIVLNATTFFSERARLKLDWLRGFAVMTREPGGRVTDTKERLARLVVTNLGRKSLRVTGAYGLYLSEDNEIHAFMFSDGLLDTSKNRLLSPEQPSTEYHLREEQVPKNIVYLGVNDGFGRTHGLWLAPWYRRFILKRRMKRAVKAKRT